ncbi:cell division protein FtsQ/DivIB [Pseudooceanicola onchidii]|uniref:cell division protein FtsQ/DivIB n=1 Tax=Pseudooceanicola onchidii TaxID=2562279 RepID=UPI0010AAB6F8|nr:cell division protein FtsQ/DivIB [Pseudooceanicola onchidii]
MQPLIARRPVGARPDPAERAAPKPKADPAPSRAAYRMQRLMLTPAYRLTLRVFLPFLIGLSAVLIYMSDADRKDAVLLGIVDLRNQIETRPEFMVKLMAIDGASAETEGDIREISQLDFPVSTFDLDLDTLRENIIGLPAVAAASVSVRQLGVLEITVTEREPALLWRRNDGIQVLDNTGIIIGELDSRTLRPDLPLIAGYGANDHVEEAMDLLRVISPLHDRLRGIVRMGERRWDIVLDGDLRIMLPAHQPVLALERAIALHDAQDVLNRDIAALDLRLAARPTLRMNAGALERWRQIKDMRVETGR